MFDATAKPVASEMRPYQRELDALFYTTTQGSLRFTLR
jgi:hypothetical protein